MEAVLFVLKSVPPGADKKIAARISKQIFSTSRNESMTISAIASDDKKTAFEDRGYIYCSSKLTNQLLLKYL